MPDSTVEIQFRLHAMRRELGGTGLPDTPSSANGHLPRITQVMALAIQCQGMIQRGEARDYADLARFGCVTRERMSQIMKLVWLAPDIQQEILYLPPMGGRHPISEVAVRRIANTLSWVEQRVEWTRLKSRLLVT